MEDVDKRMTMELMCPECGKKRSAPSSPGQCKGCDEWRVCFFCGKPEATLDEVYWHPHLIVARLFHAPGYTVKQPGFTPATLDDLSRAARGGLRVSEEYGTRLVHAAIPRCTLCKNSHTTVRNLKKGAGYLGLLIALLGLWLAYAFIQPRGFWILVFVCAALAVLVGLPFALRWVISYVFGPRILRRRGTQPESSAETHPLIQETKPSLIAFMKARYR